LYVLTGGVTLVRLATPFMARSDKCHGSEPERKDVDCENQTGRYDGRNDGVAVTSL
jgi:hypothetical protein